MKRLVATLGVAFLIATGVPGVSAAATNRVGTWHRFRDLEVRVTHVRMAEWLSGPGHASPGFRYVVARIAYRGTGNRVPWMDWAVFQDDGYYTWDRAFGGLKNLPEYAKVRPGHPVRGWLYFEVQEVNHRLKLAFWPPHDDYWLVVSLPPACPSPPAPCPSEFTPP